MQYRELFFDEQEAVKELRNRGYRVVKEEFSEASKGVDSPKKLLRYFYARRQFYNPDRRFPDSINYKEGLEQIGSFLRRREKLGLSRKQAIEEATILIEMLFKYEEHFNLNNPIHDPAVLMVNFIVNKACAFANGEIPPASGVETEEMVAELNKEYSREFASRDAVEASERMSRVLESLNGKK